MAGRSGTLEGAEVGGGSPRRSMRRGGKSGLRQGREVDNVHPGRPEGKCSRKNTAYPRQSAGRQGEIVG